MCRWIAYSGSPIFINQAITMPNHSLVEQSLNAQMYYAEDGSLLQVNGDGFGIGWYAEREIPGLFKDESPAWSNRNLRNLCDQIRSHVFFAHVRASTTGGVQRSNCHPFKYQNWLFQHNGHVSNFERIKKRLHQEVHDDLYPHIKGSTDSETFFYIALTHGLMENPKDALQKMVDIVQNIGEKEKTEGLLNLSCALTNGKTLYTLRYAINDEANSQFYSTEFKLRDHPDSPDLSKAKHVVVVSEPLDQLSEHWTEIPENSFVTIQDNKLSLTNFI